MLVLIAVAFLLSLAWATAEVPEGLSAPLRFGGALDAVPAAGMKSWASVACDTNASGVALIVWSDARSGRADVYGQRLDRSGVRLDAVSFPLAGSLAEEVAPEVAFGGGTFLVVWVAGDTGGWRLEGQRVPPDGTLPEGPPIVLAAAADSIGPPAVCYGAGEFLIAWAQHADGRPRLLGIRASPGGAVLDETPFVLGEGRGEERTPALAFDGQRYLLAWTQKTTAISVGRIMGRFVLPGGVIDGPALSIDGSAESAVTPAVVYSSSQYVITWNAIRQPGTVYVRARRVSPAGVLIGERTDVVQDAGVRLEASASSDGENYLICWVHSGGSGAGVYTVGMNAAGELRGAPVRISGQAESDKVSAAWTGSRYVVAYSSRRVGEEEPGLLVAWIGRDNSMQGTETTISLSPAAQLPCGLAFGGSEYLVVWEEPCSDGWRVRGARVSPAGELLDPGGVDLLPEAFPGRTRPTIAHGDGSYLLLWSVPATEATSRLYAMGLDAATMSGTRRTLLDDRSAAGAAAAVSWWQRDFLAAWPHASATEAAADIWMARLSVLGDLDSVAVAGDSFCLALQGPGVTDPALAFSGEEGYLFAGRIGQDMQGVRLARGGLAPAGRVTLAPATFPSTPRAMFDGRCYYVTWLESDEQLVAVRMLPNGILLDPGQCRWDQGMGISDPPAIAFSHTSRLVAWGISDRAGVRVEGARVGADGLILPADRMTFSDDALVCRQPILCAGPEGDAFIIYARHAPAESGVLRLAGRLWREDPPELRIALHQNPGVTSDVMIYLTTSEPLDPATVCAYANGTPLELSVVDSVSGIHGFRFQARSTPGVNVWAHARDLAGVPAEARCTFALGLVTGSEGGCLADPSGRVVLRVPPRGIIADTYLMIAPEDDPHGQQAGASAGMELASGAMELASGTLQFLLSPPGVVLLDQAALQVRVDRAAAPCNPEMLECLPESVRVPVLEQQTASGWRPVSSQWDESAGVIRATISSLGRFRALWRTLPTQADPVTLPALRLSHDPGIWRDALTIRFELPVAGQMRLVVLDLQGRTVCEVASGHRSAGLHSLPWDGTDSRGGPVPSGCYFTRLQLKDQAITQRSLRIR